MPDYYSNWAWINWLDCFVKKKLGSLGLVDPHEALIFLISGTCMLFSLYSQVEVLHRAKSSNYL